jgi:hypothetical protein
VCESVCGKGPPEEVMPVGRTDMCVCVCVCVTVTDVHPILRGTKSHLVLMPSHIYDLPCVDSDAYP